MSKEALAEAWPELPKNRESRLIDVQAAVQGYCKTCNKPVPSSHTCPRPRLARLFLALLMLYMTPSIVYAGEGTVSVGVISAITVSEDPKESTDLTNIDHQVLEDGTVVF